jgi:hypothetical protein
MMGNCDSAHDKNTKWIVERDGDNDGSSIDCDISVLFFLICKDYNKKMISQVGKCLPSVE